MAPTHRDGSRGEAERETCCRVERDAVDGGGALVGVGGVGGGQDQPDAVAGLEQMGEGRHGHVHVLRHPRRETRQADGADEAPRQGDGGIGGDVLHLDERHQLGGARRQPETEMGRPHYLHGPGQRSRFEEGILAGDVEGGQAREEAAGRVLAERGGLAAGGIHEGEDAGPGRLGLVGEAAVRRQEEGPGGSACRGGPGDIALGCCVVPLERRPGVDRSIRFQPPVEPGAGEGLDALGGGPGVEGRQGAVAARDPHRLDRRPVGRNGRLAGRRLAQVEEGVGLPLHQQRRDLDAGHHAGGAGGGHERQRLRRRLPGLGRGDVGSADGVDEGGAGAGDKRHATSQRTGGESTQPTQEDTRPRLLEHARLGGRDVVRQKAPHQGVPRHDRHDHPDARVVGGRHQGHPAAVGLAEHADEGAGGVPADLRPATEPVHKLADVLDLVVGRVQTDLAGRVAEPACGIEEDHVAPAGQEGGLAGEGVLVLAETVGTDDGGDGVGGVDAGRDVEGRVDRNVLVARRTVDDVDHVVLGAVSPRGGDGGGHRHGPDDCHRAEERRPTTGGPRGAHQGAG